MAVPRPGTRSQTRKSISKYSVRYMCEKGAIDVKIRSWVGVFGRDLALFRDTSEPNQPTGVVGKDRRQQFGGKVGGADLPSTLRRDLLAGAVREALVIGVQETPVGSHDVRVEGERVCAEDDTVWVPHGEVAEAARLAAELGEPSRKVGMEVLALA